jgi:hypothetical protein
MFVSWTEEKSAHPLNGFQGYAMHLMNKGKGGA